METRRVRKTLRRRCVLLFLIITGVVVFRGEWFPFISQLEVLQIPRKEGLVANSSQFLLEGQTFRVFGGSLHYFRVPQAYWKDRMLKMKACGINTVTTYVPWNLHEPERGKFQFRGDVDLEAFLYQAAQLNLWVILQLGPYICAELDLGGLPSWLLRDKQMRLRTTYPGFVEAVDSFFDQLIPRVVPLQYMKGGPIIAVQVEDEYGSFAKDRKYMPYLVKALRARGIRELLLTSDNHQGLKKGGVKGALQTLNMQKINYDHISYLYSVQPDRPVLVMKYWTGRFDGWGEIHHSFPAADMISAVREMLRRGLNVNLHMFHGGTNFGFISGALVKPSYTPLVPSYDFDAPLSESGEYTSKYLLLRDLLSQYVGELPNMPRIYKKKRYEAVALYGHLSLWDALPFTHVPFQSPTAVSMENLPLNNGNGQAFGYTLYETTINGGGFLRSQQNVRDRALVFVNRIFIGKFTYKVVELVISHGEPGRILSILVENCGRTQDEVALNDQRKGMVGDILFNDVPLRGFTIYSLDMTQNFINSLFKAQWLQLGTGIKPSSPGFFQGWLFVDGYPSDTFIKLQGWVKGVIFINGHNIGRYWDIGPQQAFYIPGPFLNSGVNQIILFEEEAEGMVEFDDSPDLGLTIDIQ